MGQAHVLSRMLRSISAPSLTAAPSSRASADTMKTVACHEPGPAPLRRCLTDAEECTKKVARGSAVASQRPATCPRLGKGWRNTMTKGTYRGPRGFKRNAYM